MRTKSAIPLAVALSVLLTACGGGQVAVRVVDEGAGDGVQPQEDVVVRFLPYDRDSIFEALEARASSPEPAIPDTLRTLYSSVIDLRADWRSAESEWQVLRDSLETLSQRMNQMDEASEAYRSLYDRFTSLEPRVERLDRQKNQAFEEYNELQNRVLSFADSIQALRQSWAEQAYAGYSAVVDSLVESRGEEVRSDTTGADGWASAVLPGGDWWVYARTSRPFEELYWNVPVDPSRTDTLRLTPERAEIRLKL